MRRREFISKCSELGIGLAGLAALAGCARKQPGGTASGKQPAAGTPERGQGQPSYSTGKTAEEISSILGADRKIGNNRWQAGPQDVDIAVAKDMTPEELVQAAVDEYGGISGWVHSGDVVAIKPNLAWARQPAQAATTSPAVLAASSSSSTVVIPPPWLSIYPGPSKSVRNCPCR